MLEALRNDLVEAEGKDSRLAKKLADHTYFAEKEDRDQLAIIEANFPWYPDRVKLPLALRCAPKKHARETAKWLNNEAGDDAPKSLVDAAVAGQEQELYAPYFLLLSYVSEAYRLIALGLEGDDFEDDVAYDGDMSVLNAAGGLVAPGDLTDALYNPDETQRIARGLGALSPESFPFGDIGPLYDFFEEYGPSDETLDEVCRGAITFLTEFYREAVGRGFGVRVFG
ncbi:MAG: hypothetical protein IH872_05230 [Chloroflexi bacterium]|nr:hypothetical protein [Chloroflexota bacterium]